MKCVAVFPKVLVIEVKVFDEEGDLVQNEFMVPEQLDLTQYLKESEQTSKCNVIYKLSAAIGVTGESFEDCTYYCISRRQQLGQDAWFEF